MIHPTQLSIFNDRPVRCRVASLPGKAGNDRFSSVNQNNDFDILHVTFSADFDNLF